ARERLLERSMRGAVFSNERLLARLFGLRLEEVTRAVGRLVATGALNADCVVDGWPGRWVVHSTSGGAAPLPPDDQVNPSLARGLSANRRLRCQGSAYGRRAAGMCTS